MKWKSFKHRFVPWVAANWSTRLVRSVDSHSLIEKQFEALSQLKPQLETLSLILKPLTPLAFKSNLSDTNQLKYQTLCSSAVKSLFDINNFTLHVSPSLQAEGLGVFVNQGRVKESQLVALYPGTIYLPLQPILLQSLHNSYILRCVDGIHIDGRHTHLSRLIYRSCAFRDVNSSSQLTSDLSWLSLQPLNPLSIGQLVNNQSREIQPNVEYIELDVPGSMVDEYGYLLPNCCYGPRLDAKDASSKI
ncbi:PREDICTED: SET domain-containing protein 9-like isoform X2 [Amphimedon queenslandica]|uniref:SET domain-containing protein n=1 Tax=Amphimedon queenslandica TaxID=400682 RepID=A0AAN0J7Z8_AMPQE|nr:PREDICTED: SET domain-containing protein 9-like isoform X2 [Amphimedon queenslandica]|eukprot:XP_019852882.1 PREDICTED: SET domain-containing protein 9-like isoform X2 [Amphimedon queenslandica]